MFNRIYPLVKAPLITGLVIFLGSLSGCATDAEIAAANGEREGASTTGIAIDSRRGARPIVDILSDASSPLAQRLFYFGFDSSSLSSDDREALVQHAEFLLSHPKLTVTVEGHADERGSREYNLALGERRARGVERVLSLLGVSPSQQQIVSFGEERPASSGHDESVWRANRRVELLYSGY